MNSLATSAVPSTTPAAEFLELPDDVAFMEALPAAADGSVGASWYTWRRFSGLPFSTLRITKVIVWSSDRVYWIQLQAESTTPVNVIPASVGVNPSGLAINWNTNPLAAAAIEEVLSSPPPWETGSGLRPPPGCERREVPLRPGEYISSTNIWMSTADGSDGAVGSISITLSSKRVFRFGSGWNPGFQRSPCSPSHDDCMPAGARIVGFHGGLLPGGGGVSRLGVVYVDATAGLTDGAGEGVSSAEPYKAAEDAVSLRFLRHFYDTHVKHSDPDASTAWVVANVIMGETWREGRLDHSMRAVRFVDLLEQGDRWQGPASSKEMFFISHAFQNPFRLLVESLEDHFHGAGALSGSVFVWCDIFAINQADPGVDLDGGRTLSATIALAAATLVVIDKPVDGLGAVPLTRLWCLFEMGWTPDDKLTLIARGFDKDDLASALSVIDVSKAACFDPSARKYIIDSVEGRFGSIAAFSRYLKLRFLLSPLRYDGDIQALLARSNDTFQFQKVKSFIEAGPREPETGSGLICVSGVAGEGKSTLAAALTRLSSASASSALSAEEMVREAAAEAAGSAAAAEAAPASPPWLTAWHFCKYSDARTKDASTIARSLAYQIALRHPAVADHLLLLAPKDVAALSSDEAIPRLVVQPLLLLPAWRRGRVTILFDALDEAEPADAKSALQNFAIRAVTMLTAAGINIVVTTRPSPHHIIRVLRSRWGEGFLELHPVDLVQSASLGPAPLARAPTRSGAGALAPAQRAATAAAGTKIFYAVAAGLRKRHALPPPPTLAAGYETFFSLEGPPDVAADGGGGGAARTDVSALLEVLMAAFEPPSRAALEFLGLGETPAKLPGWGLLFQEREFRICIIHKSLAEWLRGEELYGGGRAPARFIVDIAGGHRTWAAACSRLAVRVLNLSAEIDPYALKYTIAHLTAASDWQGLAAALGDFDFWQHVFRLGGIDYAVMESVAEAAAAAAAAATAAEAAAEAEAVRAEAEGAAAPPLALLALSAALLARDIMLWLSAYGRFMRKDRGRSVLLYATSAPTASLVAMRARAFHRASPLVFLEPSPDWPALTMTIEANSETGARAVCFSPDGSMLALAAGKDLFVFETTTGSQMAKLGAGHASDITACAWSSDGRLIVTSGLDCCVRVWDAETGELSLNLGQENKVFSCAISADCSRIAFCTVNSAAELSQPKLSTDANGTDAPKAEAGPAGVVAIVSAAGGTDVCRIADHSALVYSCCFAAGDSRVLSGGRSGALLLHDAATGEKEREFSSVGLRPARVVACVAASEDGTLIVTGGYDNLLILYDAKSGTEWAVLRGHIDGVTCCCFVEPGGAIERENRQHSLSPEAAASPPPPPQQQQQQQQQRRHRALYILSGSRDRTLRLWELSACAHNRPCVAALAEVGVSEEHLTVAVREAAPDAKLHLGGWQPCVAAVRADGRRVLLQQEGGGGGDAAELWRDPLLSTLIGHTDAVRACSFDRGAAAVASCAEDGTLRLWDLASALSGGGAQPLRHFATVNALAFAPDGSWVVSAAGLYRAPDRSLKVWSCSDGKPRLTLEGHTDAVTCCAVSPDGETIASGGFDCTVALWGARDGALRSVLRSSKAPVNSIAFSPGRSALLAWASGFENWIPAAASAVTVWSLEHSALVKEIPLSEPAVCCAFSSDGSRLAYCTVTGWPCVLEASALLHGGGGGASAQIDGRPSCLPSGKAADALRCLRGMAPVHSSRDGTLSGTTVMLQCEFCSSDGSRVLGVSKSTGIAILRFDGTTAEARSQLFMPALLERCAGACVSPTSDELLWADETGLWVCPLSALTGKEPPEPDSVPPEDENETSDAEAKAAAAANAAAWLARRTAFAQQLSEEDGVSKCRWVTDDVIVVASGGPEGGVHWWRRLPVPPPPVADSTSDDPPEGGIATAAAVSSNGFFSLAATFNTGECITALEARPSAVLDGSSYAAAVGTSEGNVIVVVWRPPREGVDNTG